MAAGVNAQIADAMTARLLRVGRVTTGLRGDVWRQLAVLEADMLALVKLADPTESPLLRARRRALEHLMAQEIDPLIRARVSGLAAFLTATLVRLAEQEAQFVQDSVNAVTEEETLPDVPTQTALHRGVVETLIPTPQKPTDLSTTGAEWWTRLGATLSQRLHDSLLMGVVLEESLAQLQVRIHGTQDNGFEDGVMARARTQAAQLVQTQVTNAVGEAHAAIGVRNASPALVAIHSSILDSRTSYICLSRHGLRYTIPEYKPIGHEIPYLTGVPYHPSCRSTIVIGLRSGGPIPDANVGDWLRRQGTAMQDEILGPTRARMFREGQLTPRNLIDALTGKPLTLEELVS